MTLRRIFLAAAAGVLLAAGPAHAADVAADGDADFLAAREAFRVGDARRLETLAERLRGHLLESYVAYWQLVPRLSQTEPAEVQSLIGRLADSPLGERLRTEWLRVTGRRGQWEAFDAEQSRFSGDDTEVACLAAARRMAQGDAGAAADAKTLWLGTRGNVEACHALFDALVQARQAGVTDVWTRIRTALEGGQVAVAKRTAEFLPPGQRPDPKALDAIFSNPAGWLDRNKAATSTRAGRETVMFALHRLARTAPAQAASAWTGMSAAFSAEERGYVWGHIALHAAQKHDPAALDWFARAGALNEVQRAWRVRAALRERLWNEVLAGIAAMPEREAADPAWRYWKARALREQGRGPEAQALLAPLSREAHFYGMLATEDLGAVADVPRAGYRPSADDLAAVAGLPAMRRSLALYRLGLRLEATREWNFAIRGLDDRQLIAAAELARREQLWDRAINTAERTRSLHDFELRYLAPHRETFRTYAKSYDLDEAWVLGLVRQESRFIHDARSSAGASGLMQIMPATARWIAGKLGLRNFRPAQVTELDTNIAFGTYYMKHVLETLDNQPVLASAGYNAGPGRARAWRPASGPMESAIYAETIPFNETRDYVKKVMSNATMYAQLLGDRLRSLKERIGTIPARSTAGEPSLAGEP